MKLTLHINSAKELKKRTYLVLKQIQQLDHGKRVDRIYSRHVGNDTNDLYILRCLGHLRRLIDSSVSAVDDPGVVKRASRFAGKLDRIAEEVQNRRSLANKVLHGVRVSDLLSLHTSLFNFILLKEYDIEIELSEWINVTNSAIAIWGDNIAPRRRARAMAN